ncbi:leucyl/phenylalanyl-tRNA--protein transferase [Sphingomonas arenae]|uniref:leucyl/phenylalanyl-tRNA--protein transferase n=1 Tax=Sphingomonas arenae TaxID=2812555 RepID=UPI00196744A7|nr:leucyl/phenylalanyl-tRNA--protein transferase [Sphingomonas arenae]
MTRLDSRLLLQGYATGVFPMADSREAEDLYWVEPRYRAILPLDGFHLSRSLAKRLRSGRFRVTLDCAFHEVVVACADREETWINPAIEEAVLELHGRDRAHSVEVWQGPDLVGGLYGVRLGRAFFGESMFSRRTDASKVALAWLVARLKVGGFALLDCQFMTEHLASLGAVTIPRSAYVALLGAAVGTSVSGSGVGGGAAAGASAGAGADRVAPPEFRALERLLEEAGAAADSAASGKFITQLLGQTS